MTTLTAPRVVGSRNQARKFLAGLPDDLSGSGVEIECGAIDVLTPSFISEVVEIVLVDRRADWLVLVNLRPRLEEIATDCASVSGVSNRLKLLRR